MTATAAPPTFDLRTFIREEVEETADGNAHDVTAAVIARLSEDDLRYALAIALPPYVADVIRADRQHILSAKPGPSKWDVLHNDASERDVFRVIVYPGGTAKRLGLCSRAEVLELVADYQRRAAETTAQAEGYSRLVARMKSSRAKTVADLSADAVLEALNG